MKLRGHTWMFLCCALPPLVQACGPVEDSGARVTVHYRSDSAGDGWTAVRIETRDGTVTGPTAH